LIIRKIWKYKREGVRKIDQPKSYRGAGAISMTSLRRIAP
jgi:hypothetical protein